MRMLVLSIEYPPLGGGASPMIHEINKQFILQGHEVTVVTMAFKGLSAFEVMEGVEVYRLRCFRLHQHISRLWEHIAFIFAARNFLGPFVSRQKFDFCFTHFLVPTGIIAKWLFTKYKIPYIITAHGSDIPGFNPDRFILPHHLTPPLLRSIIRSSTRIVAPSRYLHSMIMGIKGVTADKLEHIPNGINTNDYLPGMKRPILLSTGRLMARKGFQYLIEAVADEPFPFEVHICGDGPMMHQLKEKAMYSKTPVIFHGWVNNKGEQYKSLLAEASIYCLVSAKENASISLLEALSSGCAVITSNVSGCPESVGDAGICIPPADVNALKIQLRKLVSEPDTMRYYMKEGRARAIREFSWPSVAQRYLDLIIQKDHR